MSSLFAIFSFSFWLINYQQEYLGNDIYLNFYVSGFVALASGHTTLLLYSKMGLRKVIQIVQIISMISCAVIVLVQQRVIVLNEPMAEIYLINIVIPLALIFLSLSCSVGYTCVTQCAYQDRRIFPFEKKGLAINCIILVSKFFTVGASFVNEMKEPIPLICVGFLGIGSIFLSVLFPSQ
mmetsp:Transcript_29935/g.45778  ORF Transcript_29935/g.45778 Transcript_29935/m.45778 type:complete len:180 (+) Transcript_29935:1022-1561(+)